MAILPAFQKRLDELKKDERDAKREIKKKKHDLNCIMIQRKEEIRMLKMKKSNIEHEKWQHMREYLPVIKKLHNEYSEALDIDSDMPEEPFNDTDDDDGW